MAQLILPDSRLEMPELLHPGRKPVGNVVVDWSHPLSRGLIHAFLANPDRKELLSGERLTDVSNPENVIQDGKQGIYFDGISDELRGTLPEAFGTSDDYTWLLILNTEAMAEDYDYVASIGTYKPGIFVAHTTVSGRWGVYTTTAFGSGVTLSANTEYTLTVRRKNGTIEYFTDGVKAPNSVSNSSAGTAAVQYGAAAAGNFQAESTLYTSYIFKRALGDAEIRSLSLNPYQFLVPA